MHRKLIATSKGISHERNDPLTSFDVSPHDHIMTVKNEGATICNTTASVDCIVESSIFDLSVF